ncbi:hypothetical protein QQF64_002013 [Cirrhinus molitorella]|uniref:Arginine vasotocin receptor n=1 Tax=Cirrhinus molitorella TaxID=172907 RepID=A0ABR3MNW2_9TELE
MRDSRSWCGGFSRGESRWLSQSRYQGGSRCSFSGGESCAPGMLRMLCPRIGVARGHVSCGSLSRSDSSLEDGREPQGTNKTEQLIMSGTGSSQEGFGTMLACNCFIP